jgi:hypothetical protein
MIGTTTIYPRGEAPARPLRSMTQRSQSVEAERTDTRHRDERASAPPRARPLVLLLTTRSRS